MNTPASLDQVATSLDDFARLARAAFDALPEPFRQAAGEVVFRIDDFADERTLLLSLLTRIRDSLTTP